jgi:hypothetical protein
MPKPLYLLNRMFLWIAFRDPTVKEIRENAVVSVLPAAAPIWNQGTVALPDS